jgi:hypothetical protein
MTSRLNDNTASEICQNTLKMWLEQCDGHDVCGAGTHSFLPTRLLDLSNVETESKVRLVLSSELDQTTRYVTLSHCWGGEVPIRLTDATKHELEGGYKLQNMPPTFRDAITVARWAGGKSLSCSPAVPQLTSMAQSATFGSIHAASSRTLLRIGRKKPR